MSNIISVTDFRNHVSDIVNRVHYKNETIFLTRGSTVVAKIVGIEPSYPYAKQVKAARRVAGNFVQAIVYDTEKSLAWMVERTLVFLKFLGKKAREGVLIAFEWLKRWLGICFMVEKESWFGSSQNLKRRVKNC
jgi:antitoxin (DNA-binding transcriptional repressor) of toxin-antitoxin stability system